MGGGTEELVSPGPLKMSKSIDVLDSGIADRLESWDDHPMEVLIIDFFNDRQIAGNSIHG